MSGTYTAVSVGDGFACALRTDQTLRCRGSGPSGEVTKPPAGTFTQVSTSIDTSCAVRTDAAIACWGNGYQLPAIAPSAAFRLPSAHKCAKRTHTLKVRVRSVHGVTFTSATVRVHGKHTDRIKHVPAAKLARPVTLRNLPRGSSP